MLNNADINKEKLIYKDKIVKIDENSFVISLLLEKRGKRFYDVTFYNNGNEIFIGRFDEDFIQISYNDGKILVYVENFESNIRQMKIERILCLYNIEDDFFFAGTEQNSLEFFDSSIDSSYLINKNGSMIRTDVVKKNKIKQKALVRINA